MHPYTNSASGVKIRGCVEQSEELFAGAAGLDPVREIPLDREPRQLQNGKRTRPLFRCRSKTCGKYYTPGKIEVSNPCCPYCHSRSRKRGKRYGSQQYNCPTCRKWFTPFSSRRPRLKPAPPEQRPEYRRWARRLGDSLLDLIRGNVPEGLPPDIREEVTQEIALAALLGELDLSDLPAAGVCFRRKVYARQMTRWRFVPLDAPIPGTRGLTYADALPG